VVRHIIHIYVFINNTVSEVHGPVEVRHVMTLRFSAAWINIGCTNGVLILDGLTSWRVNIQKYKTISQPGNGILRYTLYMSDPTLG
jgi:hypothetical protein